MSPTERDERLPLEQTNGLIGEADLGASEVSSRRRRTRYPHEIWKIASQEETSVTERLRDFAGCQYRRRIGQGDEGETAISP